MWNKTLNHCVVWSKPPRVCVPSFFLWKLRIFRFRFSLSFTNSALWLNSNTTFNTINFALFSSVQSLSHVQLFATLWTAAHQASLSITNSQSLLKLTSTESVIPSNHLILCHPLLLPPSIFPSIRKWCFQRSQFFTSGGQRIGVSASASVLPINIQDLFPLEWTGWISVQYKGLSRVFSNTTTQKHQFSFPYSPTLTSIHDYWKNNSFEKIDLC